MRMTSMAAGAALLFAASSVAYAQNSGGWFPQNQPRGFYVGGALGGQYLENANISGGAIQNDIDLDIGAVGLVNFGYAFGNGFRTELELGGRWNGVKQANGNGASGGSGDVYAYSAMVNLLYDINTGTRWTPYFGGGAGWTWMDYDGTGTFAGGTTVDSDDNEFTLQLIAGVDYSIDDNWRIGLQYRYFFPLDPEDLTASNGQSIDSEYKAHNVLLTLRYTFWTPPRPAPAPAPAAAPAPAPAPAPAQPAAIQRSYLVFFDFDRSNITPEAARVIQQAADNAKRGGVSRIVVTGHTDTSGPAAYNQRLSERRATAVRDELVKNGMTTGQITTIGKGETDLLVKTGDNVREPQNRRAEIVLQ